MTNTSYNAVVERNVLWNGPFASEPYECGWAREAIVFVRALAVANPGGRAVEARIQISPDGIRWIDEGGSFILPQAEGQTTFRRVAHFGNWLRIAGDASGVEMKVLVTLSLKA
ncbi:MAG: DUF6385 domain-containing protein [Spirochaetota bacterium]